jgi:hypothetical protein
MENSNEILKQAVDKAGVKAVAAALNLSPALVYKWCERPAENDLDIEASGKMNPLDRLKAIYQATQDIELINWVCQIANGFFVVNPISRNSSADEEIFKSTQLLIKEFSDTLNAISQSYSDDKKIDPKEAERIRKKWEELKRSGERFVKECELGNFNGPLRRKTNG